MDKYEIIKFIDGDFTLDVSVSPEEETVWLKKEDIALLFGRDRTVISKHISKIYSENELLKISTCAKNAQVQMEGGRKVLRYVDYYNLDVIIAVGYRVNSERGFLFRKWATNVLKPYMLKGFAVAETRCLQCEKSIFDLQIKYQELQAKQNNQIIYFSGDQLRGFIEIKRFLETATKEIIIIDNYFGHKFDEVLSNINVKKIIITNQKNKKIDSNENYKVIKNDTFHDRFIIVDNVCYHFGASIDDIGKDVSIGTRINEPVFVSFLKSFVE